MTEETLQESGKFKDGTALASRTAFLSLSFGLLGCERTSKGTEQEIETTADKALLKVKKTLFESDEYAIIKREDSKFKTRVKKLCLAGLADGIVTVPKGNVTRVFKLCAEHEVLRTGLVEAFKAAYPAIRDKALLLLGPLGDPKEYPPVEEVGEYFYFTYNFVTFDVPEMLKGLDVEMAAQQAKSHEKRMKDATEEIQQMRRALMLALVQKLQVELAGGTDAETGKEKRFHKSAITKLQAFLDEKEFAIMNVTDDQELAALAATARNLMNGVSVDMVKNSDEFKAALTKEMAKLGDALKPLVEDKGRVIKDVV